MIQDAMDRLDIDRVTKCQSPVIQSAKRPFLTVRVIYSHFVTTTTIWRIRRRPVRRNRYAFSVLRSPRPCPTRTIARARCREDRGLCPAV